MLCLKFATVATAMHRSVSSISLAATARPCRWQGLFGYVLPGAQMRWILKPPADAFIGGARSMPRSTMKPLRRYRWTPLLASALAASWQVAALAANTSVDTGGHAALSVLDDAGISMGVGDDLYLEVLLNQQPTGQLAHFGLRNGQLWAKPFHLAATVSSCHPTALIHCRWTSCRASSCTTTPAASRSPSRRRRPCST